MIRVGIVGAGAEHGWAARAHVPAIAATDGVALTAVCNRHEEKAERARADLGAAHAFTSPADLARCDDVDLVVVAVKVPKHAEVVEAAHAAGKPVYCEWPLARDAEEARKLPFIAGSVVGLQARAAPAIRLVREAVRSGTIGEVLSSSVLASGRGWGAATQARLAYTEDARNGASMLSIAFGHAVDAFCWALGEFAEVGGTLAIRRPRIPIDGTGASVARTVYDQVAVTGTLEGGAVASIHYRGGRSFGTDFLWEINGTEGDIIVTAPSGQLQMTSPTVAIGRGAEIEDVTPTRAGGVEANVASAYRLLTEDGSGLATFPDAVARHDLLARIEELASASRNPTKEPHA